MSLILPSVYTEDPTLYDGLSVGRRDPDYVRAFMPLQEPAYRYYFRVRARGFEHIPADGPMLLIGNHNGGITTADTGMTAHAWFMDQGPERPVYAMVHPGIFTIPYLNVHAMKLGCVSAHPKMAMAVLEKGWPLLLYPGGGDDAYKPYYRRNEILFGGNTGFIKLALRYGAPIVPVVTTGGHDTLMVLDNGRELAQKLGLDKLGIERLPISLSLPWGLTVGTPYIIPFPAKIEIEIGAPITFPGLGPAAARDRDAVRGCFDQVTTLMQHTLDRMVRERRASSH
ncbi:MAG TPA: acyltransferase family protein [Gammaproteobacteria bacterium]|nr:acyltransferase family protein [Gammaproteobacteria bacterium]